MGRAPCCDKANVKKGPWAPEEDAKLRKYIHDHGIGGNWIALPQKAGLKRCGKSCRLRWLNYLRPDIKHGGFSEDEERIICSLFARIGSRWSIMSSQLPGRTDNDIKNYWNTKLKKKILMGMVSCSYTRCDEKRHQEATDWTPLVPSQYSSSSSAETSSCSHSDGNLYYFINGYHEKVTQETVMDSNEKATPRGLFGGNPLDKYDINDIKQLISTNNSICCNHLNSFL